MRLILVLVGLLIAGATTAQSGRDFWLVTFGDRSVLYVDAARTQTLRNGRRTAWVVTVFKDRSPDIVHGDAGFWEFDCAGRRVRMDRSGDYTETSAPYSEASPAIASWQVVQSGSVNDNLLRFVCAPANQRPMLSLMHAGDIDAMAAGATAVTMVTH